MFGLSQRGELQPSTETEFENLTSRLKNLWLVEHNEDGTHQELDVTAIPDLDASKITSGTFDTARIPDLDASKITTGALAKARQHAQTAYKDETNAFVEKQTISKATSDINEFLLQLTNSSNGTSALTQLVISNGGGLTDGVIGVTGASYTAGTFDADQLFLNAGATLSNGLLVRGVNGLQLAFPAAQRASADANTLDDYEEGSWTPVLSFGGASVGLTYSVQTGTYTKIGRLLSVECRIALTAKGSSTGIATITGIPANYTGNPVSGCVDVAVAAVGLGSVPFIVASGASLFVCHQSASTRAVLTEANFADTTDFRFSIVGFTA